VQKNYQSSNKKFKIRSVLFKIINDKYKKYKKRRKLLNKYGRNYINKIKNNIGDKNGKMLKKIGGLYRKGIRNTDNNP